MYDKPLRQLKSHGQSVWLDFLSRDLIDSGDLARLIDEDGVTGVTTNPNIFEKAVGSGSYDEVIRSAAHRGEQVVDIYRRIALEDVSAAAALLEAIHAASGGRDGYVSLEVSPHLAYDIEGTITEARQLWESLGRGNIFIKVPATLPGLRAIRRLIAEGININVTLLFGIGRYEAVAEAYLAGLEDRLIAGLPVDGRPASVASFFLSRIDTLVDRELAESRTAARPGLAGHAAIACAKAAYGRYRQLISGVRFQALSSRGAWPQRLLWASTGTKNPEYADTLYVDALVGPETITTLPPETLEAYRDHGRPEGRLTGHEAGAGEVLAALEGRGIDMADVAQRLEAEGVQKFIDAYDGLFGTIGDKLESLQEAQ